MLHRFRMSWSVTWCLNCLECVGSLPFVLECINRFRLFLDVTKINSNLFSGSFKVVLG